MKFLLDENLSPLHAQTVRDLGHDAVSVIEIGFSGASDEEVRAVAIAADRILLTLDADFANVLRYPTEQTPGVVRLRLHPAREEEIAQLLKRAIPLLAGIMVTGKLVVVDENKIRIRG